jgi:hypothetical protein
MIMENDMNGLLEVGYELRNLQVKFDKLKKKQYERFWIYICPFCFKYFPCVEGAFLHLQPGEW